ncbi:hypothetical protein KCP77_23875 [Salmonella enterica subsp. enterica]|nr:hypothetical protein KCP77_23875 [Salmonella enterica subsp. enterica]
MVIYNRYARRGVKRSRAVIFWVRKKRKNCVRLLTAKVTKTLAEAGVRGVSCVVKVICAAKLLPTRSVRTLISTRSFVVRLRGEGFGNRTLMNAEADSDFFTRRHRGSTTR